MICNVLHCTAKAHMRYVSMAVIYTTLLFCLVGWVGILRWSGRLVLKERDEDSWWSPSGVYVG